MSSKDSAEDKLIASIQKTKAQASQKAASPAPQPAKAASRKTVAKKPAAKKKAVASKPTRAAQSNKAQLVDMFQHGRRVWPD